jgi:hypothetical protein
MKATVITYKKAFLDERIVESEVRAVILGGMGQSYESIRKETGLTYARIALRLKKAGVKLSDWRNGRNSLAVACIQAARVDSAGIADKIILMLQENRQRQQEHARNIVPLDHQLEDTIKRRQIKG